MCEYGDESQDKSSMESSIQHNTWKNHQVLQDALISADLNNMDIEDNNKDSFDECLSKASMQ